MTGDTTRVAGCVSQDACRIVYIRAVAVEDDTTRGHGRTDAGAAAAPADGGPARRHGPQGGPGRRLRSAAVRHVPRPVWRRGAGGVVPDAGAAPGRGPRCRPGYEPGGRRTRRLRGGIECGQRLATRRRRCSPRLATRRGWLGGCGEGGAAACGRRGDSEGLGEVWLRTAAGVAASAPPSAVCVARPSLCALGRGSLAPYAVCGAGQSEPRASPRLGALMRRAPYPSNPTAWCGAGRRGPSRRRQARAVRVWADGADGGTDVAFRRRRGLYASGDAGPPRLWSQIPRRVRIDATSDLRKQSYAVLNQ
jgi:hypothetical protein